MKCDCILQHNNFKNSSLLDLGEILDHGTDRRTGRQRDRDTHCGYYLIPELLLPPQYPTFSLLPGTENYLEFLILRGSLSLGSLYMLLIPSSCTTLSSVFPQLILTRDCRVQFLSLIWSLCCRVRSSSSLVFEYCVHSSTTWIIARLVY